MLSQGYCQKKRYLRWMLQRWTPLARWSSLARPRQPLPGHVTCTSPSGNTDTSRRFWVRRVVRYLPFNNTVRFIHSTATFHHLCKFSSDILQSVAVCSRLYLSLTYVAFGVMVSVSFFLIFSSSYGLGFESLLVEFISLLSWRAHVLFVQTLDDLARSLILRFPPLLHDAMDPQPQAEPPLICSQSKCSTVVIQDGPKPYKTCKRCRENNSRATAARRAKKKSAEEEPEEVRKRCRTDGASERDGEGSPGQDGAESSEEDNGQKYVRAHHDRQPPRSDLILRRPSRSLTVLRPCSPHFETRSKRKNTSIFVVHTKLRRILLSRTKNASR
jgi:hypothetical protein